MTLQTTSDRGAEGRAAGPRPATALRRPNFFIVGAAKSGTTSMQKYLGQHPDIAMPQRREPIFFGQDLTSHTKRTGDAQAYLQVFAGCGPEKIVGEKTVRSEEHTSELQSLMRISYAVFCLKKKKKNK